MADRPLPTKGRHVACLMDGSAATEQALIVADRLAAHGGRLSLIVVDSTMTCPLVSPYGDVWLPDLEAIEDALRGWLGQQVGCRPGDAEGVLLQGYPLAEVGRWAREHRPDLLVIPARGGGRLRRLVGGDAVARLRRHVRCPVVVAPVPECAAVPVTAPVGALGASC